MRFLTTIIVLLAFVKGLSQDLANGQYQIALYTNDTQFVVGEELLYSLFCIDAQSNKLDKNIKSVYVALIGRNEESLFQHKIAIESGHGQGGFLLPVDLASGPYKLIAYTEAMQVMRTASFLQTDITIVNPYLSRSSDLFQPEDEAINTIVRDKDNRLQNSLLTISLSKNSATTRERLSLQLKSNFGEAAEGDYVISIRKKLGIKSNKITTSKPFSFSNTGYTAGTIVSGILTSSTDGSPVVDEDLFLSVGGTNFIFDVVRSNSQGKFQFYLDRTAFQDNAIVGLARPSDSNYTINFSKPNSIEYATLSFPTMRLLNTQRKEIEQRAIYNQVESAYSEVNNDILLQWVEKPSFLKYENKEHYVLSEFNTFPTMEDIILEYIVNVWVANDKQTGMPVLRSKASNLAIPSKDNMMLFVDGYYQSDIASFLESNTNLFKSIAVIRSKFQFSNTSYEGVLLANTITGDYQTTLAAANEFPYNFQEVQAKKQYASINQRASKKQLPDYRVQLYWEPNFRLDPSTQDLIFYTSDVTGIFEVTVCGFSERGVPVYVTTELEVR